MYYSSFEVFAAIVKEGSLVRAAEKLHLTPAAVSLSLSALEEEFGFKLVNRTRGKNSVLLTSNGELILRSVSELLEAEKRLHDEVNSINGLVRGTVSIGAFNSVCVLWLPSIIRNFHRDYPQIQIKILQAGYHKIEKMVLDGQIDIGFVSRPTFEDINVFPLYDDKMWCIAGQGFFPDTKNTVSVEDIKQNTFLLAHGANDIKTSTFIQQNRIAANIDLDLSTDSSVIAFVESGAGLSIMPEMVLQLEPNNCARYFLEDFPFRHIALGTSKNTPISPATNLFQKYIINYLKNDYRPMTSFSKVL